MSPPLHNKNPLLPNKLGKKNQPGLSQNASSPSCEGPAVKKVTVGKGHLQQVRQSQDTQKIDSIKSNERGGVKVYDIKFKHTNQDLGGLIDGRHDTSSEPFGKTSAVSKFRHSAKLDGQEMRDFGQVGGQQMTDTHMSQSPDGTQTAQTHEHKKSVAPLPAE